MDLRLKRIRECWYLLSDVQKNQMLKYERLWILDAAPVIDLSPTVMIGDVLTGAAVAEDARVYDLVEAVGRGEHGRPPISASRFPRIWRKYTIGQGPHESVYYQPSFLFFPVTEVRTRCADEFEAERQRSTAEFMHLLLLAYCVFMGLGAFMLTWSVIDTLRTGQVHGGLLPVAATWLLMIAVAVVDKVRGHKRAFLYHEWDLA